MSDRRKFRLALIEPAQLEADWQEEERRAGRGEKSGEQTGHPINTFGVPSRQFVGKLQEALTKGPATNLP